VLAGPFAPVGRAAPGGVPFCDVPGQIRPHPVAWYTIKMPRFSSGPQLALDFAVEPLAPQRIYVTNGIVVMRSTDSGCHWEETYSLASGAEYSAINSHILEIEVSAPATVYLPIQQEAPASRPHVVFTKDAGESWTSVDGPLLDSVVGTINDFDASLGNASAAAMLVDVEHSQSGLASLEADQILFTTSTAGAAWEPKHVIRNDTSVGAAGSGGTISIGAEEVQHVVMNPFRPNEVWVYGDGGVFVSDGVNLDPVDLGRMSVIDISLDGSAVVGYGMDSPDGYVSMDRGASFDGFSMSSRVDSTDVVVGAPVPVTVLSTVGRVYSQQLVPGQTNPVTLDLSPLDGRPIFDVQFGVKTSIFENPLVFGRTPTTIEVAYRAVGEEVDEEEVLADVHAPVLDIPERFLQPASKRVVMRPGQSREIPYTLGLPAAVTPLDVYFMIDISGSMQNTIDGIRAAMQDIVEDLVKQDIDVHFGVGAFRAFNDPPAYDRVQDIGPPGPAVADALNSLRAGGGGAETQMAALMESVTGAGMSGIPPHLNMHFRPGSLRVAIEVTDEEISQGGGHPAYTEVIDALVEHDVKQVGLAIQAPPLLGEPNYDNPGEPAGVLQKVATGSDAVAPEGGVDCDGDGDAEIEEGGPLVCLVDPGRADDAALMSDAIVSVLEAIQDIQDLTVSVSPSVGIEGPSRVVESFAPTVFPNVDLKEPSAHEFDVTVTCPHIARKTTSPLNVTVARRGGALGAASLTVVCKPRPGEEPTPILPVFTPIAAILPPLPRPPDPIPEPNPNPQPNPQQNPQAGFAAQEQQQPQVALAQQQGPELPVEEESASDEYFATARHHESDIPPLAFIFAAAGVTSVYAFAALARRRTRTAHAGNRRRRR
ncbi:MAG: hypothetical protein ACRDI3_08965, partial [Actinomycetota bacterium]